MGRRLCGGAQRSAGKDCAHRGSASVGVAARCRANRGLRPALGGLWKTLGTQGQGGPKAKDRATGSGAGDAAGDRAE